MHFVARRRDRFVRSCPFLDKFLKGLSQHLVQVDHLHHLNVLSVPGALSVRRVPILLSVEYCCVATSGLSDLLQVHALNDLICI